MLLIKELKPWKLLHQRLLKVCCIGRCDDTMAKTPWAGRLPAESWSFPFFE